MPTGTVKWFNTQKGFGFIAPDQGGPDAFVHISAVERAGLRDLREGQKVDFELVSTAKAARCPRITSRFTPDPGLAGVAAFGPPASCGIALICIPND